MDSVDAMMAAAERVTDMEMASGRLFSAAKVAELVMAFYNEIMSANEDDETDG